MRVVISIGDDERALSGRVATIVALATANRERINAMRHGSVTFDCGPEATQVSPSLVEHLATLPELIDSTSRKTETLPTPKREERCAGR